MALAFLAVMSILGTPSDKTLEKLLTTCKMFPCSKSISSFYKMHDDIKTYIKLVSGRVWVRTATTRFIIFLNTILGYLYSLVGFFGLDWANQILHGPHVPSLVNYLRKHSLSGWPLILAAFKTCVFTGLCSHASHVRSLSIGVLLGFPIANCGP